MIYNSEKIFFSLKNTFAITIPILFFLFLINIQQTFAAENVQNATIASTDYNFIAAGDWYCNEETKKTINNILIQHPELIITTGDQVKESLSAYLPLVGLKCQNQ